MNMSGISSGVGLISNIPTADLIDQLIAIEARPVRTLQARVGAIDVQRAAFLSISAQLLGMQNAAAQFGKLSFFNNFSSSSTNDSILTASASDKAVPGSFSFRVHSLVTNHAVISRGFADTDRSPIGTGTLSLEIGQGRVNPFTDLDTLNGGQGIRRGTITITDRSGAKAEIDLSTAMTVEDVLEAINGNTTINVRASVTSVASGGATGDRIVIEDLTGETLSNLIVADGRGGSMATDLGIAADVVGTRIDGSDLVRLSLSTPLSLLNDGNGVGRLRQGAADDDILFSTSFGDFGVSLGDVLKETVDLRAVNSGNGVRLGTIRITDRAGNSVEIDLADETKPPIRTVGDVRQRITEAVEEAGVSVSIISVNSHFQLSDISNTPDETAEAFVVEDVIGHAAADLGIAASEDGNAIIGRDIYSVSTLGDVIRAINFAPGNADLVRAEISDDGNGIRLFALGEGSTVTVSAGGGSTAAADLGILDASLSGGLTFESRALIAGMNTVLLTSLNGGSGVELGEMSLTDRLGQIAVIDFSDARTLQDVIDLINADATITLVASVNSAGTGIELRDTSTGSGTIGVSDVTGSLASDLGLGDASPVDGGRALVGRNLQLQYIARQTLLAELNSGRGVEPVGFQITDSNGAVHIVNLSAAAKTIGEVIDAINAAGEGALEARINDTGDGILVVDLAGGDKSLTIEDRDGGQTASDLRLAGTAKPGETAIDGSYEIRIELGGGDTLEDLVRMIQDAGGDLVASILNDGGSVNPFSLTITSAVSGRRGELVIDASGLDFGLETLIRPKDAVLSIGGDGSSTGPLITSSSNTVSDVVKGLTLNLLAADDETVTITVSQDVDGIVDSIQTFVDRFNDVQAALDDATSFNADSLERGPLLGDSTVDLVRTRLQRAMLRPFEAGGTSLSRLSSIGLRLGRGSRLEFDTEKFREVYERSPEQVEKLFTTEETGFGAMIADVLDEMTRSFDGVIARKDDLLNDQQELLNDRIDRLNVILGAKRARLENQFIGLERALAALQAQQAALTSLSLLSF